MPPAPDIAYAVALSRRGACIHAAHSLAQADLYEIDWNGQRALLKDFNGRPALVRRFWSRPICARETRALHRLADLKGTPHLLATAGACAFIMERIEGERLPHRGHTPPSANFWASARGLLDRLHAAGIAHGDLRRKNIFIGPGDEAYLIDFATAARERQGGLEAQLSSLHFRYVRRIDRVTFARIKASYDPGGLDATEQAWLADDPLHLRFGRFLKRHVYRLRKPGILRERIRYCWRWLMVKLGRSDKKRRYH